MPWLAQPLGALAAELETAPAMRPFILASASMKQFTVEPVPTPTTLPATTYGVAASPTMAFNSSCVMWQPAM